nr:hypothetical protein MarFTME_274 [Marseillevirus futianmevirus]
MGKWSLCGNIWMNDPEEQDNRQKGAPGIACSQNIWMNEPEEQDNRQKVKFYSKKI